MSFTSLEDLANQLENLHVPDYVTGGGKKIQNGDLCRLAILAHGSAYPGSYLVNGQARDSEALKHATVTCMDPVTGQPGMHCRNLRRIGDLMSKDSTAKPTILLIGCGAGRGREGEGMSEHGDQLLIELSKIWIDVRVVAFTTVSWAEQGAMERPKTECTEPGVRETYHLETISPDQQAATYGKLWPNLTRFPWRTEKLRSAKTALNGKVILPRPDKKLDPPYNKGNKVPG